MGREGALVGAAVWRLCVEVLASNEYRISNIALALCGEARLDLIGGFTPWTGNGKVMPGSCTIERSDWRV